MVEEIKQQIVEHLKSGEYRPQRARGLAGDLNLKDERHYSAFRQALKELMDQGKVVMGARGTIVLPAPKQGRDGGIIGVYSQKRGGFGFVVPSDPAGHEDLYVPKGDNGGALTGDVVRARITSKNQRDGKSLFEGRVVEVIERKQKNFVGTLQKVSGEWFVFPDGNAFARPIATPDAASKHIKVGTKVVVELTQYPDDMGEGAEGVITEALGQAGEKDVDLKSVIVQFNLPGDFPEEVKAEARAALDKFKSADFGHDRYDLTNEIICTIDPVDAKDYDDAISLKRNADGEWELGVHIADVSFFVPEGSALDVEAKARGNSTYFPGHVIPMLPEVLSNGVCSLQEGVPRLCKSCFITFDEQTMKPVRSKYANTIIKSRKRLRYEEAQAIIDRAPQIPHPDGPKRVSDYPAEVVKLLDDMNHVARKIQKRRHAQGQIVLDLPQMKLVLDEEGKVVDAVPEDTSFTHTLIEMFMVEANEAVARLLDSLQVPFLRRTHPGPDETSNERLRQFVQVAGYKLPKTLDHKAIQSLLGAVRGKPESFALNMMVLRSLSRAEYSPEVIGHFALASEHYCHFTSPIRRYADLTIHRLLDAYFHARENKPAGKKKAKVHLDDVPTFEQQAELGKHISYTERRSEEAERELRQVKVLELLGGHVGEEYQGVVTGITNFGIFIQIQKYLIDGLIRYEDLLDDWWDVDDRAGVVRGQRTGMRIGIGDVAKVRVAKVDVPRRELSLAVIEVAGRKPKPKQPGEPTGPRGGGKRGGGGGGGRSHGGRGKHHSGQGGGGRKHGGKMVGGRRGGGRNDRGKRGRKR